MNQRGQTLVLFSVSMLALVVMVCVTLMIGMRVREKVELQTLADAGAYSSAVETARAYNQIAVWNRAQIAHMMTLAGVQSHISYASWHVSLLKDARDGGADTTKWASRICRGCGPWCKWCCTCCPTAVVASRYTSAMGQEHQREVRAYRSIHEPMATQAKLVQQHARLFGTAGQALYADLVRRKSRVGGGGLAKRVLELGTSRAINPAEYSITNSSMDLSTAEMLEASAKSSSSPAIAMTNGSRKSGFLRSRSGALPIIPMGIAVRNRSVVWVTSIGTGHIGLGEHNPVVSGENQAWGEDHGTLFGVVNIPSSCPLPTWATRSKAWVKSVAKEYENSAHFTRPSFGMPGEEDKLHELGSCIDDRTGRPCNSIWVTRQEFNINHTDAQKLQPDDQGNSAEGGAKEQWRQPKTVIGLQRTYSARTRRDPWELNFELRDITRGSSTRLDLKGDRPGRARDWQRTLATAITYYHRHMSDASLSWAEPPNFFNPYWRATLVPADIDGPADLDNLGRDLIDDLRVRGFKGIQ